MPLAGYEPDALPCCLFGARCNILVYAALLIHGWKAETIEAGQKQTYYGSRLNSLSLSALYQQRRIHQDIAGGPVYRGE